MNNEKYSRTAIGQKDEISVSDTSDINVGENKKAYKGGVFLYALKKLTLAIYSALSNGFFGYCFCSFSKINQKLNTGFFAYIFGYVVFALRFVREKLFGFVSVITRESKLIGLVPKLYKYLLRINLRMYAIFITTCGAFALITRYMSSLLGYSFEGNGEFIAAILMIIAVFPLLFSSKTLSSALSESKIFGAVFIEFLGFPAEIFVQTKKKPVNNYTVAFLAATIVSVVPYIINLIASSRGNVFIFGSFDILLTFVTITVVCAVLYHPEAGVLVLILSAPFALLIPAESTKKFFFALIITITISYVIKLARSKRLIKFNLLDVSVVLFALVLLISGLTHEKGPGFSSHTGYLLVLILIYFAVTNLMDTKEWIHRTIFAIVLSASLISFGAFLSIIIERLVVQNHIFGVLLPIAEQFLTLTSSVGAEALCTYFILITPIILAFSTNATSGRVKFLMFASVVFTAFTIFSKGNLWALLGFGTAAGVYMFIKSRRTFRFVIFSVMLVATAFLILPQWITGYITEISVFRDTDYHMRQYIWQTVIERMGANIFCGIGGDSAVFKSLFTEISLNSPGGEFHSYNTVLQIIVESGIVGLTSFVAVICVFFSRGFEYMKAPYSRVSFNYIAASLASVMGILVYGNSYYILYSDSIFLLLWVFIGLINVYIRVADNETFRRNMMYNLIEY